MQFHFGMQPVEIVGEGVDADGDGVVNEVMIGEHSALHIFVATLERPFMENLDDAASHGFTLFQSAGCASCHVPELQTRSTQLPLRFPMIPTDPPANTYYLVDLSKQPVRFDRNDQDGVSVPLFADLKRHDMGDALAESFGLVEEQTNREFTTARLWGIADTAPYLHDGRATTLTEAILLHGSEAQQARDNFEAFGAVDRENLLSFLRSLRTPEDPLRNIGHRSGSRVGRGGNSRGTIDQQVAP
jgi:cytochrome c peroxidase